MSKQKKNVDVLLEEALVPEEEQRYTIPDNWVWTKLGAVTDVIGGGTPKSTIEEYYENGTIPWITPADLSGYNKIYIESGKKNITDLGLRKSSARLLPVNTVLLSSRAPIGYVAIASKEVSTNQGFKSFVPSSIYYPKYLYWYLKLSKSYLESLASGSTFKELSGAKSKEIHFPLPPLNEQKRIAEKVERLLGKIEEAKQLIEEAKETFELRRASILDKAFRGGFYSSGKEIRIVELDGISLSLPMDWDWITIEEACELISDCPHSTPKYIENGEYPAIRTSDVRFGKIDISNARRVSKNDYLERTKRTKPQKGDAIYCREGTVGNAGIIGDEIVCLAQRLVLLRPNVDKVLPEYFVYVLNSPILRKQVFNNISQTTSPRINISTLKKLRIPIAPISIQKDIVNIVEKCLLLEQQAVILQKENRLDELKQSILSKAFHGALGTNVPNEESAIELLKEVIQEK